MRNETLELIDKTIMYVVINPILNYGYKEWCNDEELNLDLIINTIYSEMLDSADTIDGYSRAIRFDGKKKILEHIQKRLLELLKEYEK